MSHYIVPIINYCENHLVQFYSVPNVRNYLRHRMHLGAIGNVPILSLRNEPLNQTENKIMKRTFDIVFSLCFLCTFFLPIYLVVGIIIKTTSPAPSSSSRSATG